MSSERSAPDSSYPPSQAASIVELVPPTPLPTGAAGQDERRRVTEALDAYPDGGLHAWTQVFCCSCLFFTTVGSVYSWGITQDELVKQHVAPSSSLAFVGSTQAVLQAVFAIPLTRVVRAYGPRNCAFVGAILSGIAPILAGSSTHSLIGLIMTQGVLFGTAQAICFHSTATLPSQYFLKKRNLATGLVYAGGGVGGGAFSLMAGALIQRVGVAWTFRITGLIFACINIPASLMLEARLPRQAFRSGQSAVDWKLFRDVRFTLLFAACTIGCFSLFTPPFFLPLYGTTIGLPTSTSSLLLAIFNFSSAGGRIGFGLGADRVFGSLNSFVICLLFVGLSTLAIWPVAESIAPLALFAVVNGVAAGGFFSLAPGVISTLFGSSQLGTAFSLITSAWAPGYFFGAPAAGLILQAYGGPKAGFTAFRPAIFYSGAMSLVAAALMISVRLIQSRKVWKRI